MNAPIKILLAGIGAAVVIAAIGRWSVITTALLPAPKHDTAAKVTPKDGQYPDFKLSSPAFSQDGDIPAKYTCDGANINPPLEISGVPSDTKSLALLMVYMDPGSGNISVHWLAWNIDPKTAIIPEGVLPAGAVQGTNDFKSAGYLGPCLDKANPSRSHFVFSAYALNRQPKTAAGASPAKFIHEALDGHTIATALLSGYYGK